MRSVERTVSLLHDRLFRAFLGGELVFDLILYYEKPIVFCITRKLHVHQTSSAEYNPFQSLDFLAFFLALAGLSSFSVFRFFSFLLSAAASEAAASRSTCCSTFITSPLNFLLVFSGPGVLNPYV